MEKAILKTLIYADIFDFPLKAWEIHKWLIGKKANLKQVEKALTRLNNKLKIKNKKGFYLLPKRQKLVNLRLRREEQSKKYLWQVNLIAKVYKLIPWLKLVGVSGSLAMRNSGISDDIDLFVIISKNRLFLSRILLTLITSFFGKRRKRQEKPKEVSGKICINILLEEDNLAQYKKDIYLAHEVLQMQPLWAKNGIYQRYLEDNSWAFKMLPNWLDGQNYGSSRLANRNNNSSSTKRNAWRRSALIDLIEKILKWIQLRYMGKPGGLERVSPHALYFHPNDQRPKVLKKFKLRLGDLNRLK